MRTPLQAMLWELWHISRVELLSRVAAQCGLIVVFYALTFASRDLASSIDVIRGIVLLMMSATCLFSTTWLSTIDTRNVGFCFRLGFTRPTSTRQLIIVPMLFVMVTSIALLLLGVLLFRVLFDTSMSFLGPAAMIACTVSCLVAATWSPTSGAGKTVGIVASLAVAVGTVIAAHHVSEDPDPILMAIGKPGFFDLEWSHYLALVAITAMAFVVTVLAVDRQRHDVGSRRRRFKSPPKPLASARMKPFTGPLAAQCWYEFRQVGPRSLVMAMLAPVLVLILVTAIDRNHRNWQNAPLVWLIALATCPLLYQFVGIDRALGFTRKNGTVRYSTFDATRPLRNDQIVLVKLVVVAACSIAGWLLMAIAATAHAVIANDLEAWGRIGQVLSTAFGSVPLVWLLAGVCGFLLLYLSSSSVLLTFGYWLPLHGGIFFGLAVFAYGHIILAIADYSSRNWSVRPLWLTYGWTFSAGIVVGCFFVLRKAIRSGCLGRRTFAFVCGLWLIYAASMLTMTIRVTEHVPINIPVAAKVFGAVSLLIPLATTAIAPLALASFRHR